MQRMMHSTTRIVARVTANIQYTVDVRGLCMVRQTSEAVRSVRTRSPAELHAPDALSMARTSSALSLGAGPSKSCFACELHRASNHRLHQAIKCSNSTRGFGCYPHGAWLGAGSHANLHWPLASARLLHGPSPRQAQVGLTFPSLRAPFFDGFQRSKLRL